MEPTEADLAKAKELICDRLEAASRRAIGYGPHSLTATDQEIARIARALAAARIPPPGHVIDDQGVVRKVEYHIYSREHNAWWGPDQSGYFVDIENAGRYTGEQADEIIAGCGPRGGLCGEGCHEFKMIAEAARKAPQ